MTTNCLNLMIRSNQILYIERDFLVRMHKQKIYDLSRFGPGACGNCCVRWQLSYEHLSTFLCLRSGAVLSYNNVQNFVSCDAGVSQMLNGFLGQIIQRGHTSRQNR